MDHLDQLIANIPIRHDIISSLMFLGVVQSFFLAFVLFIKKTHNTGVNWLAGSILASAIIFLDTYLCYTGLIKFLLPFNDSTEALVLLVSPTAYFGIYGLLWRKPINIKKYWWHFLLPVGYFLSQIPFYLAPISVKYNAYIGAYYSNYEYAHVPVTFDYSYHYIKDIFDWLVLFSFLLYTILSVRLVLAEKNRLRKIGNDLITKKYLFTRNTVYILLVLFMVIFIVYYNYDDDGGDHYLSIFHTLITFLTTYVLIMESRFFEKSWIADKYETLSQGTPDLDMKIIEDYVNSNQYFLNKKASLKDLADSLQTHPNLISKVINQGNNSNFNDFINQKRVQLSQSKLVDPSLAHLTIEAIGTSVGFKSKSAFYSAFKRYTGVSPSTYIKKSSPKL